MNEAEPIATWVVLQEFGFTPETSIYSNLRPGLEYDFGKFTLSAALVMNRHFVDVVHFSGVIASSESIGEVEFEMPLLVESREQCAAWIAWHLAKFHQARVYRRGQFPAWLYQGAQQKHLLPWVRDMEEYRARPQCSAEREWLKLALRSLARYLTNIEDTELLEVAFDGDVLSFRLPGNQIVLAAKGAPWKSRFSIPAGKLRRLPKRIMSEYVEVSVWRSRLNIGRHSYDGVVEVEDAPKQQADT